MPTSAVPEMVAGDWVKSWKNSVARSPLLRRPTTNDDSW